MARLLSLSSILPTSDMTRTSEHYTKLGFTFRAHDESYGTASRDGFNIHFHRAADDDPAEGIGAVYFAVDDAAALHEEWSTAGVGETSELFDPGYGVTEALHTDPDGNLIRFGSAPPPTPPA